MIRSNALLFILLAVGGISTAVAQDCTRQGVENALTGSIDMVEEYIEDTNPGPESLQALYLALANPVQMEFLDPHTEELDLMLDDEHHQPTSGLCAAIYELVEFYEQVVQEHALQQGAR